MNPVSNDPIDAALREDLGEGDVTTEFFVPETAHATGRIVLREKAVIAGAATAAEVFGRVDASLHAKVLIKDGVEAGAGECVLQVYGLARSILNGERVALNFLQRLSGIATLTRQFVEAAANDRVTILDTRKTTPGLRELEKAAVRAGGGSNHRFGLHDMVLIKDNHLNLISGLSDLARRIQELKQQRPGLRIEIEADDLEQVRAFVALGGVDVILLDNMTPGQIREAVSLRQNEIKFEASGGITLRNIRRIAATGVDYISVGALTHSARAIDFSLELEHAGA